MQPLHVYLSLFSVISTCESITSSLRAATSSSGTRSRWVFPLTFTFLWQLASLLVKFPWGACCAAIDLRLAPMPFTAPLPWHDTKKCQIIFISKVLLKVSIWKKNWTFALTRLYHGSRSEILFVWRKSVCTYLLPSTAPSTQAQFPRPLQRQQVMHKLVLLLLLSSDIATLTIQDRQAFPQLTSTHWNGE